MSSQPEQQQLAQAAGKKGKKKKKVTTLSLNDFLGDDAPTPIVKTLDWADESEELDGLDLTYQSSYTKKIVSTLPTGPRASRTIEVDMSKLPDEPPFTAFVGNLPYEADEEMLREFFKDMEVLSVRLPEENGRFKGYGYVEFADKNSLAEALQHNEETFNRRQIRVDVAGSKNQGDSKHGNRGYGGSFGTSSFDGPDVTEGEWRRKPDEGYQPPSANRGYGESDYRSDRGGSRDDYSRSDRYGDRRHGGYGESDYRSDRSDNDRYQRNKDDYSRSSYDYGRSSYSGDQRRRDYQGSDSYGRDGRSDSYGRDGRSDSYGRDGRGYGRYQDHGYNQGSGYGGDRGSYSDRSRDYQTRDYYDRGYDKGGGYGYDRGYGGSKEQYSDSRGGSRVYGGRDQSYSDRGRSSGYADRYDSRDKDYGRDRYQDAPKRDDYDGRGRNVYQHRPAEESREQPQSRPQLKLQPRTRPITQDKPAEQGSRSSIFGGAKPVDTAAREKEIEEKLKEERENAFRRKDERESFKRPQIRSDERQPRESFNRAPRRSSERSDEGQPRESFNRAPRKSSERSDEGQPRESFNRVPRKSSERSDEGQPRETFNHAPRRSSERLDEGQPRESFNRAPRRSSERSDEGQPRESFKRAPRRSDEGQPSSTRGHSRRISSDRDLNDAHRRPITSPGRQQEDIAPKDKPNQRDYRPAPPPKQSAWGKRRTNENDQGLRKPSASESAAEIKKPAVRPASTVRPAPSPITNQWSRGPPKIDSRGVREEAEGNAREDDRNERTPEGAADDNARGSDGSSGDGNQQRRNGPDKRHEDKPRQHGDGSGKGHPRREQYDNRSDYRRRGDGGIGKRRDWDRERPARGYDEGKGRPEDGEMHSTEEGRRSRGDTTKKGSQEKRRDSSRDSRPECDRSAAVGQEQDFSKAPATKGRRHPKGPPELEPEPVIEFVQKSKFSALTIEDEETDYDATQLAAN